MSSISVVSLDFGGTIAYEPKEEHVVYLEILRELGHELEDSIVREKYEEAKRLWSEVNRDRLWNEEAHLEFIENFYSLLSLHDNVKKLAKETLEVYPYRLEIKPFEDVKPTLEIIRSRNLKLIVISNITSEKRLKTYLTRIGLINYFDKLIASGSIGFEKPSPQIFHHACRLAGCYPSDMVHVGDSYEHDYLGAENIGAKGVLIDRENKHSDKNCRKISDMRKLVSLLEEAL